MVMGEVNVPVMLNDWSIPPFRLVLKYTLRDLELGVILEITGVCGTPELDTVTERVSTLVD
jgi:hypothetical protein